MMKLSYGCIIFVVAILAAVFIAGCTTSPSSPAATATPGGASATPTGATATPAASSPSTLGSLINYKNVKWFEYQTNSNVGGTASTMKMREDFNVDFNGKNSNKFSLTMDTGSGDSATNMVMTSYADASSGATLGGHMKMTAGGQVVLDQDIQAGAAASTTPGTSTESPLTTYQGSAVVNAGIESVTVPAGTYMATKYTWTSGDTTGTVWVAPNVPVPVKMTSTSAGTTMDMELTGWG